MRKLNKPVDISKEFLNMENIYFNCSKTVDFNPDKGNGILEWKRYQRKVRMAFNHIELPFAREESWEFPGEEYPRDYQLPFSLSFVSSRTVRIRMSTRQQVNDREDSLMIEGSVPEDDSWETVKKEGQVIYKSSEGTITINQDPFGIVIKDKNGKILTKTQNLADNKSLINSKPIPLSFIRRPEDLKRRIAASFSLSPEEKIFGTGESFTRLNKRGQKINIWAQDAHGAQTDAMYKPIPFFMSSRGYGMFVHTSTPLTFDFGNSYDSVNTIYLGDEYLDLFIFLGEPKDILSEYTALTGRSSVPPLWSFGLWMSRITYESEAEARNVAEKLRENEVPSDVIHLDTGWFEEDWRCDYKFASSRFDDPEKMIQDLKEMGFRISLWQLPYFNPQNDLYQEAIDKGYVILDKDGNLPTEDAIVDFSNPEAVKWYQYLLANLLEMGVSVIKADFGEAAPLHGQYASGKSGFQEHNLYPLRYNKAVAEITEEITGEKIIWGRSTWAGSQRYPLHWGGDAENTDGGMAASLRAGLSLGLCGFTFWSHDIGGFVEKSPEELYRRWTPFGMLTSHSRCHGAPPKEPWAYSDKFLKEFRQAVELKYQLMPYIYTQAKISADKGYPMLRSLFFEYPDDPTSWFIEDEYLFGSDLLVAPLMESGQEERKVYLPPGTWIDYQTGQVYQGTQWHEIKSGEIPVILLIKSGAILPKLEVAQSTAELNWEKVYIEVYNTDEKEITGYFALPEEKEVNRLVLDLSGEKPQLKEDPYEGKINWELR
ncbi:MAG: TIM-barrel domain-containing protein [Bacillota bacterium]